MEAIFHPFTDYSRTVWRLNEEVVILRELFVKRISCSRPLRVCNFFLSLAFSSWTSKERKGATPLRRFAGHWWRTRPFLDAANIVSAS
jgi:hypothetical protein